MSLEISSLKKSCASLERAINAALAKKVFATSEEEQRVCVL